MLAMQLKDNCRGNSGRNQNNTGVDNATERRASACRACRPIRRAILARFHTERGSPMPLLLTRNSETRHRDTMTWTSSGEWFLRGWAFFKGFIVSNVIVSRCWTIVIERIGSVDHETEPTGNSVLVISYVDLILALYAPRTFMHLSTMLLDI